MSISLVETLGNSVIRHNGSDSISIRSSDGYTRFEGTDAMLLPSGTTDQRPSGDAGAARYNTTNTALEVFNGTSWKTVGALDGSTSALAAPSAVYLKNVAGVTQNGTYWINVNNTPTQIYCNFTWDGGGWMSFASAPIGRWPQFNSGTVAWTGLNFSAGSYSASGAIGEYWRNISGHGSTITQVLFATGNGTYWIRFPLSQIDTRAGTGWNDGITTGYATSGNFPSNQYNANSTYSILYRAQTSNSYWEDPWINAGNVHGNGGDASGTDYMVWGEQTYPGTGTYNSHGAWKDANGGIIVFVR